MTKASGERSTADPQWVSADPSKGRIDREKMRRYDPEKDQERVEYYRELAEWERKQAEAERAEEPQDA